MTSGVATGGTVRILAPAKINLGLAVLGRRGDGYHELRTIFQAVSLCDRVALRRARSGVRVNCPALPDLGENNLAHRAAALFFEETGAAGGVVIDLEKRIPAAAGLGGGSSDAAAVLLGCCRLFGLAPERGTLRDWAARLGSDVPFFLDGGTAVGSGRGEILEQIAPFAGAVAALINIPAVGLSTAAVYRRLRPKAPYPAAIVGSARGAASGNQARGRLTGGTRKLTILLASWQGGDLRRFARMLFNDLEPPAFALAPELADVKDALFAAGADGALLCGSGSSVFGLFGGGREADRARGLLRGRIPGRLIKVHFLPARRRWGVVKR